MSNAAFGQAAGLLALFQQLGITKDGYDHLIQSGIQADVVKAANAGVLADGFDRRELRRLLGYPIIDRENPPKVVTVNCGRLKFRLFDYLKVHEEGIRYMVTFWDLFREKIEVGKGIQSLVEFPITRAGMLKLLIGECSLGNLELTLQSLFLFMEQADRSKHYVSFATSTRPGDEYCMITTYWNGPVLWADAVRTETVTAAELSRHYGSQCCVIMPLYAYQHLKSKQV